MLGLRKQVCEHVDSDLPAAACMQCQSPMNPRYLRKYPLAEQITKVNGVKQEPATRVEDRRRDIRRAFFG